VEDLNVEDKLRERFGDFTPFLDDDDDELIGELEQEGLIEQSCLFCVCFFTKNIMQSQMWVVC
jgi:hypothetical protein